MSERGKRLHLVCEKLEFIKYFTFFFPVFPDILKKKNWLDYSSSLIGKLFHYYSLFNTMQIFKRAPTFTMLIVVVQWSSYVGLFGTPWTAAHQASLSLTISQFAQVHGH